LSLIDRFILILRFRGFGNFQLLWIVTSGMRHKGTPGENCN